MTLHFTRTTDEQGPLYFALDTSGLAYIALSHGAGWYGTVRTPAGRPLAQIDWTSFPVHVDEMLTALRKLAPEAAAEVTR